MAPTHFKEAIYVETPNPGIDANKTFKIRTTPYPKSISNDQVLVRSHYLSLDPAMRQWLTAKRSYIAPVELGAIMRGQSIAQVVDVGSSIDSSKFKKGDWVLANTGWAEYATLGPKEAEKIVPPQGCYPRDFMSLLGMVAMTAYFGMLEVGQIKKGETVVVSGAAGATGMIAGQIAKIKGCHVYGIAGSNDKCDFLKNELGFDGAFNYKDPNWKKQLRDAIPKTGIDVMFDNVGGEVLDVCLARAAMFSRFVICGSISQYNAVKPQGPASFMTVISHRVTIRGFIVFDYVKKYAEARKELAQWIVDGKLKRKEHIVKGGLEKAPSALIELFDGKNTGKMMVEVAPMEEATGGGAKL